MSTHGNIIAINKLSRESITVRSDLFIINRFITRYGGESNLLHAKVSVNRDLLSLMSK